jgi:hypothetical protein
MIEKTPDEQRRGDCIVVIANFLSHKYGMSIAYCKPMAGKLEKVFRLQHYTLDPMQFKDVLREHFSKATTWEKFVRWTKHLELDRTLAVGEIAQKVRQTHRRPQRKEDPQDQVNLFHAQRKKMMDAETKTD